MQSRNPAFSRRPEFTRRGGQYGQTQNPSAGQGGQYGGGYGPYSTPRYGQGQYGQPQYGSPQYNQYTQFGRPPVAPTGTDAMTIDDVVTRSALLFATLAVTAAAAWFATASNPANAITLWAVGAVVTLVLGFVISFSRAIRPAVIVAYAAFEGLFVGAISRAYEYRWDGVVGQAVLATLAVFAAMLVAYRVGAVRATPRFTRMLVIATLGYAVFCLVQFVSVVFFHGPSVFNMGVLGVGISVLGTALAAFNLVLDFSFIEQGIANRLPRRYAWLAAHGLVVTLVWLYVELLRLIAILRGND